MVALITILNKFHITIVARYVYYTSNNYYRCPNNLKITKYNLKTIKDQRLM